MKTRTSFLALTLLASSCAATRYVPLVDIQASPAAENRSFDTDVVECQSYAATIDPGASAVAGAVAGAVLDAALGAALGGILGNAGLGASLGAANGGIQGLAYGAAAAEGRQREIVNNCMYQRGWNIL